MPSPFPGMDPYLEDPARWPGVHQSLITYLRDDIQPRLPKSYVATIGERIYVATQDRSVYPDVMLVQRGVHEATADYAPISDGPVATPLILTKVSEPRRVPYIEILLAGSGDVVTVIELISPANKTVGRGREQYLEKRVEILRSRANLVEMDLLGEGMRVTDEPRDELGRVPFHRYIISVNRAADRDHVELYPIQISDRLPRFRIPLRPPDEDVITDVQAAFNRCYDNGRFATLLDYSQPPRVLLSREELAWAQQVLQGEPR